MASIVMERVYYRYRGQAGWALEDVSLSLPWGRILVAGGTGSGKTTLLRVASGAAARIYGGVVRGKITLGGKAVLVPQNFDAFILMPTPRLELIYVMENIGFSPKEIDERLQDISESLGISALLDRRVATLSAGERQRVAIASALAMSPDILMLDEPLAYVDPQTASKVLDAVASLGVKAVIVAEHRLHILRRWATHLVYMEKGRVKYTGPMRKAQDLPLSMAIQLMDPGEAARVAEARGCLG
ncbi:MAG: energy-coupling factor ABC transporter ATP-binding protein [Desulfurococcales archaeon]|nr:energy-coupling factor ABC transporter ATP-binding protein [Desulfurococcales archaeon]